MSSETKIIIKILIIDDSAAVVKFIEALLSESQIVDYVSEHADSLDAAFKKLSSFKCDNILLDLNIKDSSGLDTLEKVKRKYPDLPVIVMTGEYSDDIGLKAVALGAQDFLLKNKLDYYSLNKAIHYAIERKKADEEKHKLEKQLQQSRTLESIGTLASGIAHEINTPMQYIQDNTMFFSEGVINLFEIINVYSEIVAQYCNDETMSIAREKINKALGNTDIEYLRKEIPSAISQSLDGIGRVKNIINAMKYFSHADSDEMQKGDINKAIENTVMVSKNRWKYVAEIKTDLDPSIPEIKCFMGRINQVIMNLILNAADAISEVVKDNPDKKGLIQISSKKENNSIVITIRDTGCGIADNNKDRIFDPFFTTKDVGKGTGQGLSIVYDIIVNQHKGSIDVESAAGKGSAFTIRLPTNLD
ncbi:MAG: ATP-binding protein [Spirochaetota bacterium]